MPHTKRNTVRFQIKVQKDRLRPVLFAPLWYILPLCAHHFLWSCQRNRSAPGPKEKRFGRGKKRYSPSPKPRESKLRFLCRRPIWSAPISAAAARAWIPGRGIQRGGAKAKRPGFLFGGAGKQAKLCQRQKKQVCFEEVPRLSARHGPTVALTRRWARALFQKRVSPTASMPSRMTQQQRSAQDTKKKEQVSLFLLFYR